MDSTADYGSLYCRGTLIDRTHVLSAAQWAIWLIKIEPTLKKLKQELVGLYERNLFRMSPQSVSKLTV